MRFEVNSAIGLGIAITGPRTGENYYEETPALVKIVSGTDTWFHVVVRTPAAVVDEVSFTLKYGRYDTSNPNCSPPSFRVY